MNKIRAYLSFFLIIAGIVVTGKLVQTFVLLPLVESAFHGNSFEYLNKIIAQHHLKDPDVRDLAFYKAQVPVYINRLIFLSIYVAGFIWILTKDNFKRVRAFFNEEKSAFSLGVLRIAVFSLILYINFPASINELSHLGVDSLSPPLGWPDSIGAFLIQPVVSSTLSIAFTVFCIGGLIGFYTRFMIIGATITGFFLMAIPQFFGKSNSYHLLWHVLLILSFSPSGDSISIDAWRKKIPLLNLKPAKQYAIPIHLIMILIGLGYFFPGFWKFAFSGFEWVFSDNLMLKMHSKWLDHGEWTPAFRIDQHPFLYQSGALFTLVIELGFIFGIFFKKVRPFFLAGAFAFHVFVEIFLQIFFASTMIMFIAFIPWKNLLSRFSSISIPPIPVFLTDNKYQRTLKFIIAPILVSGYIFTSSLLITTWPFKIYPTFASIESPTIASMLIIAYNENGEVGSEIPLLSEDFKREFDSSGSRIRGYMQGIINSSSADTTKYSPLINIYFKYSKTPKSQTQRIEFYQIRLNTNPDSLGEKYSIEKRLYTWNNSK